MQLHGAPALLRLRRLRCGWRLVLLLVRLFQGVQEAAAGRRSHRSSASGRLRLRRCCLVADDRCRLAVKAREPGQQQAGYEKTDREHSRRARQEVGRAPARHKTRATTHSETAAFGFLQQHSADQHRDDHEVNDNDDSQHLDLSSQASMAGIPAPALAGFHEVARCYTIAPGVVTPDIGVRALLTSCLLASFFGVVLPAGFLL
jgi:hypothetical protein